MKLRVLLFLAVLLACSGLLIPPHSLFGQEFHAEVKRFPYNLADKTVIGAPREHATGSKDNMLDIARIYGLGYNEVGLLYPRIDPWLPPDQKRLIIPSFWVLPPTQHEQLVINVPELRLFFFERGSSTVQTYPIGIGDEGWETPLGTFTIVQKREKPSWYIPASLQEKYGMAVMPPGPENPLGDYVMKFSAGAYGIHGTHMPWGVGRLVSHGCIRCYPEHIRLLYPQVPMGAKLEIIYQPVKIGQIKDQIFVEAHPDVYQKIPDYQRYAVDMLMRHPLAGKVDQRRFQVAINLQNGVPTNVTRFSSGDGAREAFSFVYK